MKRGFRWIGTAAFAGLVILNAACNKERVHEDTQVALGRELFNSTEFDSLANHTLSCGTCHPGGDMDHKKWLLPLFAESLATPTLFGVGETAPYLWFGEGGSDLRSLTKSVIESVLLGSVDSVQLDALVAYQLSLRVPANPWRNSDGSLTPAQERGRIVFENQGKCRICHEGPAFTEPYYNIQVRKGKHPADVPSLRWVFATAPYFYDNSVPTLTDVVNQYADSVTTAQMTMWGWNQFGIYDIDLTQQEKEDLVEYLRTL